MGAATGRTPTFFSWDNMIQRCTNPRSPSWPRYGGRGIAVCDEWRSFARFLADMGERPDGRQLGRIDTYGPYANGNCRWATSTENVRNRRNTKLLFFEGETLPVAEWSERTGIPYETLRQRVDAGWSARRALSAPLAKRVRA